MSDDLVRRLREEENSFYGTHPCGLLHEAADRIEQLEGDIVKYSGTVVNLRDDNESLNRNLDRAIAILTDQKTRIEKLEAALRRVDDELELTLGVSYARKLISEALEGEKDE